MRWQSAFDASEERFDGEDFAGSFSLADIEGDGLASWPLGDLDTAVMTSTSGEGADESHTLSAVAVSLSFFPLEHADTEVVL